MFCQKAIGSLIARVSFFWYLSPCCPRKGPACCPAVTEQLHSWWNPNTSPGWMWLLFGEKKRKFFLFIADVQKGGWTGVSWGNGPEGNFHILLAFGTWVKWVKTKSSTGDIRHLLWFAPRVPDFRRFWGALRHKVSRAITTGVHGSSLAFLSTNKAVPYW